MTVVFYCGKAKECFNYSELIGEKTIAEDLQEWIAYEHLNPEDDYGFYYIEPDYDATYDMLTW